MTTVRVTGSATTRVAADPARVWQAMKDYGNLDWSEGIAEVKVTGDGVGMVRSVRLEGSEEWLDERLLAVDGEQRRFEYGIDPGFAGVANYRAAGQALAEVAGPGAIICWQCGGEVAGEEAAAMTELMDATAQAIAGLFAAQFS